MAAFPLLCGALLLGAPFASLAQSTDPAPSYRFYGGLALYSSDRQWLGRFYGGDRVNLPVQATLGYQLRPRLAVQVALAYSGTKGDYSNSYDYTDNNANLVNYALTNTYVNRAYATSVLARYTLTRQAAHRFQVDALGGLSFDHTFYHFTSTQTYTSQGTTTVEPFDYANSYNTLLINFGPSLRYRFGQRFEAVYDLLFNVPLTTSNHNPNLAMALGARYRFGR